MELTIMQVYLFGNFQVHTSNDAELTLRPTAARLFAFLLLHRHQVHLREVVAESFWQNSEINRARRSLNTTLWQLRNTLDHQDNPQKMIITATQEQITINQEANLWLDVAAFDKKARQGEAYFNAGQLAEAIQLLEEAIKLYQGDLLQNFYDPWVLQERERLRLTFLRCLSQLMRIHQQLQNFEASIDCAQQILRVEPWREDIHRTLMTLYIERGMRANAIRQYQICRQLLASELAVSPMRETEMLYHQLLNNPHMDSVATEITPNNSTNFNKPTAKSVTLQEATVQLQTAINTLQTAQKELNHAIAVVERLSQLEKEKI
jgi:DNA-binding SARP family transcriptional activator